MVQTIVIVSEVTVRAAQGRRTEERRNCFPVFLPNDETKREVARILCRGNVRFLDGDAKDIATTPVVAQLVDSVRPFMREIQAATSERTLALVGARS